MTEKKQIIQSASVITLATLISRICGYLRDQRIMLLLGTSLPADCYVVAFRIPNLLRRLVGEGALAAAFVPVFTGYLHEKPSREVWLFAQRLFWTLALLLAALVIFGVVFSPQLVGALTSMGGDPSRWDLAVYLNRIIFPYVFFICLGALGMAILNSLRVFGLPASTPIVFNLILIAFTFGAVYRPIVARAPAQYHTPAVALAVGVFVAGVVQFGMLVPSLWRHGMRFSFHVSVTDPGVREVARLMLPFFFGSGLYQINLFVDTAFAAAARMPQGSVSSLYVADRVMELALGTYAIAVSTAILPMLSRHAALGEFDAMKETFGFSLRLVSFITVPAAAGLILLRGPIIQVLFQHGAFVAESTRLTVRALVCYALGLPAFAAVKLIVPLFYALRDTRTPVLVGVWALALNIALNGFFVFLLFALLKNGAPALATSLTAYFNFCALFFIFRKRFGGLGARRVLGSLAKVFAATAAMTLGCMAMLRWIGFERLHHLPLQAGVLAGMIAAAAGCYVAVARLLGCEEISELLSVFERREPAAA